MAKKTDWGKLALYGGLGIGALWILSKLDVLGRVGDAWKDFSQGLWGWTGNGSKDQLLGAYRYYWEDMMKPFREGGWIDDWWDEFQRVRGIVEEDPIEYVEYEPFKPPADIVLPDIPPAEDIFRSPEPIVSPPSRIIEDPRRSIGGNGVSTQPLPEPERDIVIHPDIDRWGSPDPIDVTIPRWKM